MHYYQPMWTLVGAGIKTTEQSSRLQRQCIPGRAEWIKTQVEGFEPEKNSVSVFGPFGGEKVTTDNFRLEFNSGIYWIRNSFVK